MNEWKLEIKKVNNGYILKGKFGDSDMITEEVIEENQDNSIYNTDRGYSQTDLSAMMNVLSEVMNYFAVYHSKHNQRNLVIDIEETKND